MDTLAVPVDSSNVLNAYRYLNWILKPEIAARNGNYVTYAPSSMPAKNLMEKTYVVNDSIFPSEEVMSASYIMLPTDPAVLRYQLGAWQKLKAHQ